MKSIQSLSTSFIVAFGLAIVSGATLAQIQGLAAPNYSLGSPQCGGETGGTSNTRTAQPKIQTQAKGRSIITHPAREIIRRSPNSVVELPATNIRGLLA